MLNHTDVKKTRAVIDLEAIAANYRHTADLCRPAEVAAVVKADAYGHGALAVAKKLESVGCKLFTVSNIDEALELRTGGINGMILVLGFVLDEFLPGGRRKRHFACGRYRGALGKNLTGGGRQNP